MNDQEFFAGLIGELEEQSYTDHPSERVLRHYVQRRLAEGQAFSEEIERLLAEKQDRRWTLTAVSLHVATCSECASKVRSLRAASEPVCAFLARERSRLFFSRKIRRRLAYSIPLVVTIALIVVLFFLPHPIAASYCRFGALAM